jgi:leucyl aminopeptidase
MKDSTSRFFETTSSNALPLYVLTQKDVSTIKDTHLKTLFRNMGFDGAPGQVVCITDKSGQLASVAIGIARPIGAYTLAPLISALEKQRPAAELKNLTFDIVSKLDKQDANNACVGYALGGYAFTRYKPKTEKAAPKLLWPKGTDKTRVNAMVDAIFMARDLINTPANDMGPEELADIARGVAKTHKATCSIIRGDDLLKKNFPLIHAVGRASTRAPLLIDINWGNPKHKRVTLVGKGIVFDTGGLDIKPSSNMLLMKKDMGGAAHMLALAHIIMSLKLPIQLRVLCPVAENAISGNAFRPKDIITSRKGLTVEIGNTDAEGRLVLADALTLASDDKPDLVIDMATLTGAAHVAVGHHMASLFARNDTTATKLLKIAHDVDDPMWRMPLWDSYRRSLNSQIADLNSTGDPNPAGSITAALFLDQFIDPEIDWIHFDFCGWEYAGRAGRPVGGTEFAIRALTEYLTTRYK